MASEAACTQQFHSMQQMAQQGGRSGLVRLEFIKTPDPIALYAHEAYLMAASGVLRDLLGEDEAADPDAAGPRAKVARTSDSSDATAARLRAIIPLHDESVTAWEEALSLLYPSTMWTASVTWDNAERLLLLADRYDMPCITEHVKRFMSAGVPGNCRLKDCITACEVFKWLTVFSRCSLHEQASICINFIVEQKLQLPVDFLSNGLQHKHLEELYNTMQQYYSQQVTSLQQQLNQTRRHKVFSDEDEEGLPEFIEVDPISSEEDNVNEGEEDEDESSDDEDINSDDEDESSDDEDESSDESSDDEDD